MKLFRSAIAAASVALMISAASAMAAPARISAPAFEINRSEARQVCHHYRGSSRRHCTPASLLVPAYRPPLYYPHRYFGGTPHYAIPYRRSIPYHYYPHRWYRYPRYY